MAKTIEITNVTVQNGDTIRYEIRDNTGLHLLQKPELTGWVKFHNIESFNISLENLPESILALPATTYLWPVTWFYGVDLVVPSVDRVLYESLPEIYNTYSRIYGPFKNEWKGRVLPKTVEDNPMPESRYDNVVFYSGGVDAVHAGVNNPGKRNVLVTVPSIEGVLTKVKNGGGKNFISTKIHLIRDFSTVTESDWLMITNNFRPEIFNQELIRRDLNYLFKLYSEAFRFDGWAGMCYLGNLLSTAPFAYALGIRKLIMGSTFEQLENTAAVNMDGANPDLTGSYRFSGISFAEQDGLTTRRSRKVKNITEWCVTRGKKTRFWVCFKDSMEQCETCPKCVRTQLNILCTGQNPKDWGFPNFSEKKFSRLLRSYRYYDTNICWIWDIVDSLDESKVYPYCNDMLHWLKRLGYTVYQQRACRMKKILGLKRILNLRRYPHYLHVVYRRLAKSVK